MASRKEQARKELARRELERRQAESEQGSTLEQAKAFGLGAAQGATLGFADEVAAGAAAVKDVVTGEKSFGQAYDDRLKSVRGTFEEAEASQPGAFLTGDVGASIATALLPIPGAKVAAGAKAGRLATLGKGAGIGAGIGAVEGAGRSEEGVISGALTGAALGAGGGAVSGALSAAATKALTKGAKAAKLGASAKQLERRLGDKATSRIEKSLDKLDDLGIVSDADFVASRSGALPIESLEAIEQRAAGVRSQKIARINDIVDEYKATNPDKVFSAQEIGLDDLKSRLGSMSNTANALDPSTSKAAGLINDIEDSLRQGKLDIDTLKDLKIDVDDLAEDLFFRKAIGRRKGKLINEARIQLKDTLNNVLGKEYADVNLDLSAIHTLEGSLSPALGRATKSTGLKEAGGLLDPLAESLQKQGVLGTVGQAAGSAAGGLTRGIQSAIDVAAPLVPAPVAGALVSGPTQGAPSANLDPTIPEDRLLIKDRIIKKRARGELDSREAAKRLQRLNQLQEASGDDSIISPPPAPAQPNLGTLDNILGR